LDKNKWDNRELSMRIIVIRVDFHYVLTMTHFITLQEGNKALRVLELISNAANQLYYPLEHIAWLADRKVIVGLTALNWRRQTKNA